MLTYKLDKEFLSQVEEPQLRLFENDFENVSDKKISINYNHKGFNVNELDKKIDSKIHSIGFFSGAGGLDIGAQLAGSKVIASLDFDKDSVSSMKANKYFDETIHFHNDIKEINANSYSKILEKNKPEKLILLGGPPCQPFSKAGYWKKHENRLGSEDPRNMIGQYLRLIEELKPDGFILENVESLLHPKNIDAVKKLEEAIEILGFNHIKYKANSADFGVPQKRKRVFFIASRKKIIGEPIKTHGSAKEILINPKLLTHERVIDWIGKYDNIKYSDDYDSTEGKYYNDLLSVPPGKNYIALTEKRGYPNPKFIAGKRYWSFLLKLHPNLPSWTIISNPGHWEGPFHWTGRRLRLKELAAIQTFPEDYIFKGSRRSIQKQIGNAVPPLMGKAMVEHLIKNI